MLDFKFSIFKNLPNVRLADFIIKRVFSSYTTNVFSAENRVFLSTWPTFGCFHHIAKSVFFTCLLEVMYDQVPRFVMCWQKRQNNLKTHDHRAALYACFMYFLRLLAFLILFILLNYTTSSKLRKFTCANEEGRVLNIKNNSIM